MFSRFGGSTFCLLPAVYHPTTIMLVDDDADFLKQLSIQLEEKVPTISFTNQDEAAKYYKDNYDQFKSRSLLQENTIKTMIHHTRQELYNKNRFNNILITVLDYEMPHKNGFDVMRDIAQSLEYKDTYHSYILLTGKRFSDFSEEFSDDNVARNYISKWDPNRIDQLIDKITTSSAHHFQWLFYSMNNLLVDEPNERALVMRDGNFLDLIEEAFKAGNACEFYLFDRQGSLMFLDEKATPYWLFIRNECGMNNSINLAKKYKAPQWVMDAILSKENVLSLYEDEDTDTLQSITWEDYLLPAKRFLTDDNYLGKYDKSLISPYYYAITDKFPALLIDKTRVVSYRSHLDSLR